MFETNTAHTCWRTRFVNAHKPFLFVHIETHVSQLEVFSLSIRLSVHVLFYFNAFRYASSLEEVVTKYTSLFDEERSKLDGILASDILSTGVTEELPATHFVSIGFNRLVLKENSFLTMIFGADGAASHVSQLLQIVSELNGSFKSVSAECGCLKSTAVGNTFVVRIGFVIIRAVEHYR